MIRFLLTFIAFFIIQNSSFSQEKLLTSRDSIENLITIWNNEKGYTEKDIFEFQNKFSKQENDSIYNISQTFLGKLYIERKDSIHFYETINKLDSLSRFVGSNNIRSISRKRNLERLKSTYHYLKGEYFYDKNVVDSAYYHLNIAKNLSIKNKFYFTLESLHKPFFYLLFAIGDIESINVYGADVLANVDNNYILARACSMLSVNSSKTNIEKSKIYNQKAFEYNSKIKESFKKKLELVHLYTDISFTWRNSRKFKNFITYSRKADSIFKSIKYYKPKRTDISVKTNLATAKIYEKNYDGAERLFLETYDLCDTLYLNRKLTVINNLGIIYYLYKKNKKLSKKYAIEAIKVCQKKKNNTLELYNYRLLAKLSTPKEANKIYEIYIAKSNRYSQEKIEKKEKYALVKYETSLKEPENLSLKQANELSNSKLLNEQKENRILQLISLIGIVLLISLIIITNIRRKNLKFQANLAKAEAREQERKEIALSLHDKVVGDLRAVYQKALKTETSEIAEPLLTIKDQIRNLSHKLSSVDFEEVSFKDQMINLASDYFEPKFRIKIQNINEIDWSVVNKEIKRTLFLVSREAIQNSKKHGEATLVNINFKSYKKTIQLEIKDDGKGFDLSSPRYGIGLKNQQQRVEELNGKFNIESILNEGTKTSILIPVIS